MQRLLLAVDSFCHSKLEFPLALLHVLYFSVSRESRGGRQEVTGQEAGRQRQRVGEGCACSLWQAECTQNHSSNSSRSSDSWCTVAQEGRWVNRAASARVLQESVPGILTWPLCALPLSRGPSVSCPSIGPSPHSPSSLPSLTPPPSSKSRSNFLHGPSNASLTAASAALVLLRLRSPLDPPPTCLQLL